MAQTCGKILFLVSRDRGDGSNHAFQVQAGLAPMAAEAQDALGYGPTGTRDAQLVDSKPEVLYLLEVEAEPGGDRGHRHAGEAPELRTSGYGEHQGTLRTLVHPVPRFVPRLFELRGVVMAWSLPQGSKRPRRSESGQ